MAILNQKVRLFIACQSGADDYKSGANNYKSGANNYKSGANN